MWTQFKALTFLLLASSVSCVRCDHGHQESLQGLQYNVAETSPIKYLNDYLVERTSENDPLENINLIRMLVKDNKEKDSQLFRFAGLISHLSFSDICHVTNIECLKWVFDWAVNYDEFHSDDCRLKHVLMSYARKTARECYVEYENSWNADPNKRMMFETQFGKLAELDLINRGEAYREYRGQQDDLILLDSALQRVKQNSHEGRSKLPTNVRPIAADVKIVLQKLLSKPTSMPHLLSRAQLTEGLVRSYFNRLLVQPCFRLLEPRNDTVLKRIYTLSSIVGVDDWMKESQGKNYKTLIWASRYITCRMLFDDSTELADEVAKIWSVST